MITIKFNVLPQIFLITSLCFLLCACQADNPEIIIPESPIPDETESVISESTTTNSTESESITLVSSMLDETESIPQLLYQRTVTFDEETGIRRSTLDDQGLGLDLYFEVPVFEETSIGYQKINTFFQNLEDDFFSEKNEKLLYAWDFASIIPHESENFLYTNSAIIYTNTENLLSVGIYYHWWMKGVNDTGGNCYTFSTNTGELLKLSDLIEETEQEALDRLYHTLEDIELDPTCCDIQKRHLDDFDFYIDDNNVFIDFDRYEAAHGAFGNFSIELPVRLKDFE